MQRLHEGYWLNIRLAEEIEEEDAEFLRKHGLDKESLKKAKAAAKAAARAGRKKWFGIYFEFRIGSFHLTFGN